MMTRWPIYELVVVWALSSLIGALVPSVTYVNCRHMTGRGLMDDDDAGTGMRGDSAARAAIVGEGRYPKAET